MIILRIAHGTVTLTGWGFFTFILAALLVSR